MQVFRSKNLVIKLNTASLKCFFFFNDYRLNTISIHLFHVLKSLLNNLILFQREKKNHRFMYKIKLKLKRAE